MGHDLLEEWIGRFENIQLRNQEKLNFLEKLFIEFEREFIEVIPLKGMDLFLRGVYRNKGLRPTCDIDLLVREEDLKKLPKFFDDRGFVLRPHGRHFLNEGFFNESFDFISKSEGIILVLVWNFSSLDIKKIWKRTVFRNTPLGLKKLLHPQDMLLYLIAYRIIQRGELSPVLAQDLEVLIECEKDSIDWLRWCAEVIDCHLEIPVYYGLKYAAGNGVRNIPDFVFDKLYTHTFKERCLVWFYQRIVREKSAPSSYLRPLIAAPNLRAKLTLLKRILFPPQRFIELRCGKKSWLERLLVGIFRPFRIFIRSFYVIPRDLLRLFWG